MSSFKKLGLSQDSEERRALIDTLIDSGGLLRSSASSFRSDPLRILREFPSSLDAPNDTMAFELQCVSIAFRFQHGQTKFSLSVSYLQLTLVPNPVSRPFSELIKFENISRLINSNRNL